MNGTGRVAAAAGLLFLLCGLGAGRSPGQSAEPPYVEEQVTYQNPNAPGTELHGTLTKPRKDAPTPAVLLIPGAGRQDRDETMAGHKPFRVLADYLSRRGIAVLRADDRGTGESTGTYEGATTKDLASDAQAGVRFLLGRDDIDKKRLGMIGHGEGAIIATMTAAEVPEISFLVLLAGTAVPGEKVLLAQTARAEMAAGLSEQQVEADERLGAGVYRLVEQGRSRADIELALSRVPEEFEPFAAAWRKQIPKLESPWLKFFLSYDPRPALEQLKIPVLALFGQKDMQVDPEQNAQAMKSAFSTSHNKEAKVKVLPGLNYLFQKADTGLAREYAQITETMSPTALQAIGDFVSKHTE